MVLTNNEIYTYANLMAKFFSNGEQTFPIKLNFCLQRNKKTLINLAQDIEEARNNIIKTWIFICYKTLNITFAIYIFYFKLVFII